MFVLFSVHVCCISLCVVFVVSRHVILSLRSVTGEIWCDVNCCHNVLSIVVQFAHLVLSLCCLFFLRKSCILEFMTQEIGNFTCLSYRCRVFEGFVLKYSNFQ